MLGKAKEKEKRRRKKKEKRRKKEGKKEGKKRRKKKKGGEAAAAESVSGMPRKLRIIETEDHPANLFTAIPLNNSLQICKLTFLHWLVNSCSTSL